MNPISPGVMPAKKTEPTPGRPVAYVYEEDKVEESVFGTFQSRPRTIVAARLTADNAEALAYLSGGELHSATDRHGYTFVRLEIENAHGKMETLHEGDYLEKMQHSGGLRVLRKDHFERLYQP